MDGTEAMEGTFFNPFSRLALYGYSVGQKGLNDEERRKNSSICYRLSNYV